MNEWIPIKTRPLTEEEKSEHPEWQDAFDCPLPEDSQEVLITDIYGNVELDTFYNEGSEGCYFENNCDDGEVVAWMPLPEPYKKEKK